MRQISPLILCLFSAALWGQTTGPVEPAPPPQLLQSREIDLAKAEIERVAELVKLGAVPRVRMEEAEEKLADAQDDVILARTLYGELPIKDLTDSMAEDMVAAAQRRVERQIKKLAERQKLVNDGVIAVAELRPFQEELEHRQMYLNLAHNRAKLIGELAALAKYEQSMRSLQAATHVEPYTDYTLKGTVHYEGNGTLLPLKELKLLETAFERHFERPLPISADGQTATHDSLGFDHRGRIDVAVNPNEPAGIWLRKYLEAKGVPYYGFFHAVPGKATGAHIHIGPGSTRLHNAD